jgi:hypothetical protein
MFESSGGEQDDPISINKTEEEEKLPDLEISKRKSSKRKIYIPKRKITLGGDDFEDDLIKNVGTSRPPDTAVPTGIRQIPKTVIPGIGGGIVGIQTNVPTSVLSPGPETTRE